MMHPQIQNHPGFQHVRHGTPNASPPMHNGAMPQFVRGPSPLPPGISRPSSRTSQHPGHMRRTSSNLVPPHLQQTQGPPQQPNYAYTPNPPFYNPQAAAQMHARPLQQGPQTTYPPPYAPPPNVAHIQQAYLQDSRRSSMPPTFPQQAPSQANMQRHPSADHLQPPQPHPHPSPQPQRGPHRPTPSPQPQQQFTSPPLPQPKPLPAHAKHNIFTPIDDSRSMLAQHWGSTGTADAPRSDISVKSEDAGPRPQSIDVAAMQRDKEMAERANGISPGQSAKPISSPNPPQQRSVSAAGVSTVQMPNRQSTMQSDAKRPRLKVQIPSEQSGDEAGTGSAPDDPSTGQPPTGAHQQQPPAHVVLPPPSPSAGALLSAGAQGPPNPFARPAPPMSTNPHAANREANHIETPISALPSRFMSDNLLPSPSTFYPEWGFGRSGDGNMLPSPLNFQTPIVPNGQGWREEDRKRQSEDEGLTGDMKRTKT